MSTLRRHGDITFICDDCGEALDTGEPEFGDAVRAKKAAGWASRKDNEGDWQDLCPDCKEGVGS